MSGTPAPTGYWCEVRAEGLVYGTGATVPYVLGTFATPSPVLALRWLRAEARRIANRLDPDPHHSPWARPFPSAPHPPVPDCPTQLRTWAADPQWHRIARAHLTTSHPLHATFPDADCTYTLSAHPVRLPTHPAHRRTPPRRSLYILTPTPP
ncbi:hypothetical protein JJV70_04740 [Streptomyces sp. JJ66]|uniref:hypothetical protein n=1 Tax=Streptomyces sp. JJ66 TaxID=2803843 RepID=UPI001C575762|nr:hypothetical protein [Streptomyces sp. JJ66]MBW1601424.1 hypothetical protein [Streptomyces sp. JJ66]